MKVLVVLCLLLVILESSYAGDRVLSIHGSGAVLSSGCFGRVMEKLETRSKLPVKMTYRAIGSKDGHLEFLEKDGDSVVVDFSGANYALSKKTHRDFTQSNKEILQLPVFLRATSFYHGIPNTPNLNLTGCVLSKIFSGEIQSWDDHEIKAINPNLSLPYTPIQVMYRKDDSSSTELVA